MLELNFGFDFGQLLSIERGYPLRPAMKIFLSSKWLSHKVSQLRNAVFAPNPENHLESLSRVSATLAIAAGFVALAWTTRVPADRRVVTLGIALGLFALAFSYLFLSKRWPAPPATFGVLVSVLASVGIWVDPRGWTLGFILFFLASLHTAYFSSARGVALQLMVASGSFITASLIAGSRPRLIDDWIAVTAVLAFVAIAVYRARRALDEIVQDDLSEHRRLEEALVIERHLLKTFLETTTDHIYIKDLESRFTRISNVTAHRLGLSSPDEAIGKTDFDFFSEEHARPAYEDERQIIRTGEPLIDFEEKESWDDGREAWVSTTKWPLLDENGVIIGIRGTSRDITRSKLAEEELSRSRELYRVVVENSHDMIAVLDPMGRFVFASPSYEQVLGYEPEELVDVSPISLVHPSDVQRASDALRQTATSRGTAVTELRMRHKRGNWVFVEGTTTSVLDENGRLNSILMSFRDISERRVAEEELREAEARYRLLVEQLPLITYINVPDESRRWVYLSPQLEAILGYKPSDWTSEYGNFVNAIHPDDRERVIAERAASGGKGRIAIEYRLISKDERTVWVRDEAVVVRDLSGKPLYVQGYLLDITSVHEAETERRRLEAELLHSQKMEAIGRLAGGIAHDFNNLLTAITGYSELIVSDLDPSSSLARDVEEIKRAAEQAGAMTQQLLAFSRRQVLQPVLLDMNEVIGHMEKMFQRLIGENIELVTELAPELAMIRSDRGQLEQVIMNLVVNARDAMPNGGKITVETKDVTLDTDEAARLNVPAGDFVLTTVSDVGFGMDEETMSHIFEPFFTTKEQGEGTGLGLATVHGIVEQSSGAIQASSQIEKGSEFLVYLPAAMTTDEEEREATPHGETHGTETLLLVEDEEMVRQLVARVLRDLGYEVFATSSGDEALAFSDSFDREIDLLVTDVVMPGMSGSELAEILTEKRPKTRVLFMSGYTDEAIVHHGVLDGVAEFIGKPFTPQELAHKIRGVLEADDGGERAQLALG